MTKVMGRPAIYATETEKKAAMARSAREYRARVKALKLQRKNPALDLTSKIIDLSTTLAEATRNRG